MSEALTLFAEDPVASAALVADAPLAERLRPRAWQELRGIDALDKNLIKQLQSGKGKPPSMILWGPPGSGKTTLAKLIGRSFNAEFIELSAVLGSVKEIREITAAAKLRKRPTILFVDEIHRFNKGQQDAFLPHVESGTIVLIGATTENPSFYLNGALLSRARVVKLASLSDAALKEIAQGGAKALGLTIEPQALQMITEISGGDARRLLNLLESFSKTEAAKTGKVAVEAIADYLKEAGTLYYDRSGDEHYQIASAFIKSLRGSNPDAALFWGFRMIESGEDPRFVIRRMIAFASEDIGNADPRGLQIAVATAEAYDRIGLPEGRIPIAQCITYLATAPKSNRSYLAMHAALDAIKAHPKVEVPLHLRNAPTGLMKSLDYGADYQYPHENDQGYVAGIQYLPDELADQKWYEPSDRGYEKTINERLKSYVKG